MAPCNTGIFVRAGVEGRVRQGKFFLDCCITSSMFKRQQNVLRKITATADEARAHKLLDHLKIELKSLLEHRSCFKNNLQLFSEK